MHRVFIIVALAACTPTICLAQESSPTLHTLTALLDTTTPSSSPIDSVITIDERPAMLAVTATTPSRLGTLLPLYVSFAIAADARRALDMRAMRAGGVERESPDAGSRRQAGRARRAEGRRRRSTILLAEKVRGRSRVGAIVLMAALNSATPTVVAHNYRTAR